MSGEIHAVSRCRTKLRRGCFLTAIHTPLWNTAVDNAGIAVYNCRFCTGFFTFIHSIPTLIPKSYSHYPQGFPQAFL